MKKPLFNVRKHLEMDAKAIHLLSSIEGRCLDEGSSYRLARRAARLLPKGDNEGRVKVLTQAFSSYTDRELTSVDIRRMSELISGCDFFISTGYQEYVPKGSPVLAPIYIESVEPSGYKHSRLYNCTLTSHGGRSAGHMWHPILPGGLLQKIIRECGGRKWGKYKDVDAGGLWLFALVGGDGSLKAPLASSSQETHNRELLRDRQGKCIQEKWPECKNCWIGREECRLSRHLNTYVKGMCANQEGALGKHLGRIVSRGYCMYCLEKGVLDKARR